MVCLFPSTDNLLTIALHFHTMAVHKHAYTIRTCYVRNAKATSGKERLWWAFVRKHAMLLWSTSQLVGKRIPMSFVPNTLADWWLTDDVTVYSWVWKVFKGVEHSIFDKNHWKNIIKKYDTHLSQSQAICGVYITTDQQKSTCISISRDL